MNRLTNMLQTANADHTAMPSIETLVKRLYERINRLEDALPEAQNEQEEILISNETRRIREVVALIKGEKDVIKAYRHLEQDLNNLEDQITPYVNNKQSIPKPLQISLDLAVYHYNEYCNAVESLI